MTTMRESAARHMAAGVQDLDELARLVEQDVGKAPGLNSLRHYRSRFHRLGEGWVGVERDRTREANVRWRGENPNTNLEKGRRWRAKNRAAVLFKSCRDNAKRRGRSLDFTLTLEEVEQMLAPMTCSATGLPLVWEHDGSSARNPWAPSLDRLDNSIGYVPGNVRVVCWAFNCMRADFPDEVVLTLAKALADRAPG